MQHFSTPALICVFFCLLFFPPFATSANSLDNQLNVTTVLNNVLIEAASTPETAITMNKTGNKAHIIILVKGEESISVDEIKTVFLIADIEVLNQKDSIESTLNPGDNLTFIQSWDFDNRINSGDFSLISGIYKVRYDLKYRVNAQEKTLIGEPFYIDFNVNPLKSVFGVVSTVAFTVTTFSAIRLVTTFKNAVPNEVNASIQNTKFKASSELKSYYTEKGLSRLQGEFANRALKATSNRWEGEKCPECGTPWEKDSDFCNECGMTLEKINETHQQSLQQKALSLGAELAGSTDGLTLSQIVAKLGDNIVPTADVLELFTFSGLAIAQPRLSKNWGDKTRSLVFTGLQWALYSVFWINACGISTVSIIYLGMAMASGIILPIIISRIYSERIKSQVGRYWKRGVD